MYVKVIECWCSHTPDEDRTERRPAGARSRTTHPAAELGRLVSWPPTANYANYSNSFCCWTRNQSTTQASRCASPEDWSAAAPHADAAALQDNTEREFGKTQATRLVCVSQFQSKVYCAASYPSASGQQAQAARRAQCQCAHMPLRLLHSGQSRQHRERVECHWAPQAQSTADEVP